jgi:hypothetical protein
MFSGHRLHPWGALAESWNGEILSLPSASTRPGLVLISEKHAVVLQDGVDEECVGVAHHPQIAPQRRRRGDGGDDVRVQWCALEADADVVRRLPSGVQLRHHPVLSKERKKNVAGRDRHRL